MTSGILQYRKAQRLAEQPETNEHVGQPGAEIEAVAQVASVKTFDSRYPPYGKAAIPALKLPTGSQLIWFATSRDQWMSEGQTVKIQGLIHRHTTYRGTKQTQVKKLTWDCAAA